MTGISAAHLYGVGDIVVLNWRAGHLLKSDAAFTVLAQLPPLGTDLQYRIKSIGEPYERVAMEHQLTRAAPRGGLLADTFPQAAAPN